ncbi:MAG: prepilin-type N-terminal cleavage/methylation domain-containing protein, partial [Planctomycetes bacterium]|nr:prepilin-type N-terminal cleavage/methylation domain-containing protein [Planctomycetota bacterium]
MLDLLQVKALSQQDEKRRVTAQMRPNTLFRTFGMRIKNSGFTLIEILIVVMIIAIAAMIAVPMMTSAASVQVRSAANLIAADLEYAKSMAMSRQKIYYAVVFDESNESYQIEDPNGIIEHPVKRESLYKINFSTDSRLNKVDIVDVDF